MVDIYSSKGYRVYNKRTRLIVESIHIKFEEIKEMMSDHNSSDLAPQRQEMSVENVSLGLVPQGKKGPLIEEYYTPAHGHAEDNNNGQAPNASFQEAEFINPFCTRNRGWVGFMENPTMPVQTRRQLATDPEMCMFALTVSIVEPKNIKEAMADSAWIEAMQDELHQFDRLKVWELVDKPFGKMIIKLKPTYAKQYAYCARYQARPTQKHLKEVKRIFKYLKGTINMGLWYPKDSGFELTAFSDADHVGLH
ncbi:retrovirus-related pol polyprotein from transposon TNT 1-94 [Tanacetum coccineum]